MKEVKQRRRGEKGEWRRVKDEDHYIVFFELGR